MPLHDEGTGNPAPQPFDPTHLANLARAQWPEWPAVADALLRCTTQWQFDPYYFDLYDPEARDARCGHRATVILVAPIADRSEWR
ncbi:MAG: hypothetical protein IPK99_01580 [Flavobacteriales bacterium]|nr:hypothetical protein [Flavobacteriales bacterium]